MNTDTIEQEETVECMSCMEKVEVDTAHFYAACDGWLCNDCMEHRS